MPILPLIDQGTNTEVSKMTLPLEAYRNISRYQAKFLDSVSSLIQDNESDEVVLLDTVKIASNIAIMYIYMNEYLIVLSALYHLTAKLQLQLKNLGYRAAWICVQYRK